MRQLWKTLKNKCRNNEIHPLQKNDYKGIRFKHEILSCIYSIDFFDETKVTKNKNENNVDI